MNEILNQDKSIYLQISDMIENDILRNVLLEDEKVPSTNELAKFFKINPATAAKGINLLVDEGILYKKRGIGMFVTQGAKQTVKNKRKSVFYENYVKSLLTEAASLEIGEEELIEMIRRAKRTEGTDQKYSNMEDECAKANGKGHRIGGNNEFEM